MARQQVIKINCDRCKRMELVPATDEKKGPDFEARFQDQTLIYEDLCGYCADAIKNMWKALKEWNREIKYAILDVNGARLPEAEIAPPTQPAPNYTPPQPHSGNSAKR